MSTDETTTNTDKLTRLRAAKALRAAAAVETREAAEIECLELEEKFSADGSRMGVDFAIVFDPDLGSEGIIVLKLGADLAFRRFVDETVSADGLASATGMYEFTAPAVVHPAPELYAALIRKRGGLANRACDALSSLHRVSGKKIEGKF